MALSAAYPEPGTMTDIAGRANPGEDLAAAVVSAEALSELDEAEADEIRSRVIAYANQQFSTNGDTSPEATRAHEKLINELTRADNPVATMWVLDPKNESGIKVTELGDPDVRAKLQAQVDIATGVAEGSSRLTAEVAAQYVAPSGGTTIPSIDVSNTVLEQLTGTGATGNHFVTGMDEPPSPPQTNWLPMVSEKVFGTESRFGELNNADKLLTTFQETTTNYNVPLRMLWHPTASAIPNTPPWKSVTAAFNEILEAVQAVAAKYDQALTQMDGAENFTGDVPGIRSGLRVALTTAVPEYVEQLHELISQAVLAFNEVYQQTRRFNAQVRASLSTKQSVKADMFGNVMYAAFGGTLFDEDPNAWVNGEAEAAVAKLGEIAAAIDALQIDWGTAGMDAALTPLEADGTRTTDGEAPGTDTETGGDTEDKEAGTDSETGDDSETSDDSEDEYTYGTEDEEAADGGTGTSTAPYTPPADNGGGGGGGGGRSFTPSGGSGSDDGAEGSERSETSSDDEYTESRYAGEDEGDTETPAETPTDTGSTVGVPVPGDTDGDGVLDDFDGDGLPDNPAVETPQDGEQPFAPTTETPSTNPFAVDGQSPTDWLKDMMGRGLDNPMTSTSGWQAGNQDTFAPQSPFPDSSTTFTPPADDFNAGESRTDSGFTPPAETSDSGFTPPADSGDSGFMPPAEEPASAPAAEPAAAADSGYTPPAAEPAAPPADTGGYTPPAEGGFEVPEDNPAEVPAEVPADGGDEAPAATTADIGGQPVQFPNEQSARLAEMLADNPNGTPIRDLATEAGFQNVGSSGMEIGHPVSNAELTPGDVLTAGGKDYFYIGDDTYLDSNGAAVPADQLPEMVGEGDGVYRMDTGEGFDDSTGAMDTSIDAGDNAEAAGDAAGDAGETGGDEAGDNAEAGDESSDEPGGDANGDEETPGKAAERTLDAPIGMGNGQNPDATLAGEPTDAGTGDTGTGTEAGTEAGSEAGSGAGSEAGSGAGSEAGSEAGSGDVTQAPAPVDGGGPSNGGNDDLTPATPAELPDDSVGIQDVPFNSADSAVTGNVASGTSSTGTGEPTTGNKAAAPSSIDY